MADLFTCVPAGSVRPPGCDHHGDSWLVAYMLLGHSVRVAVTHSLNGRRRKARKYICAASKHAGPESGAGIEAPELSFHLHPPRAGP